MRSGSRGCHEESSKGRVDRAPMKDRWWWRRSKPLRRSLNTKKCCARRLSCPRSVLTASIPLLMDSPWPRHLTAWWGTLSTNRSTLR